MTLSRAFPPRVYVVGALGIRQRPRLSPLGERIASFRGAAGWIQDEMGSWWASAAELMAYVAELEAIDRLPDE